MEFVERGWEWRGTFTHDELKFDHTSQQMTPSASRALMAGGVRDSFCANHS